MRTIYLNGKVYTGTMPLKEAFAVEDGLFAGAGTNAEMRALAGAGDQEIDLAGKFVCAGFNDSHMHVLYFGTAMNYANLSAHTDSLEGLIREMQSFLKTHPVSNGTWLQGYGWNQDYFTDTDRMPTRDDLDRISPDIPIMITRACGHVTVVNSKVIDMLGIDASVEQPEGGRIGVTDGRLDGRFYDNAMGIFETRGPIPDKEAIKGMLKNAFRAMNAYGVTSAQSDDLDIVKGLPWQTVLDAFHELEAAGEMTVRIYEQSRLTTLDDLKAFVRAGNVTGVGTDVFKIGPLKMLGDGALGARTAYLSRPYADDPTTQGFPTFSEKDMNDMVAYANDHNMQVAIHAIGDACLDRVLHAYELALAKHPRQDHRHGVIHCQISRPDQLAKIAAMHLHVYAQSIFLDYDNHIVRQRVGDELAASSYSWKTLMKNGVSVSNGSDCPVELPNVMAGMQCAITRTSLRDHCGPYLPEQAFTVQEALDSYTIRGAEGSFEEKVKGRIEKGMLADFVMLGGDPFETEPDKIKDIPVLATYMGGRCVYSK